MRPLLWASILLLGVAIVGAVGWLLQRETAAGLRREISLLESEAKKLAALQATQRQLVAAAIPEPELQRLRADHAALARLRREITEMQSRLEAANRAATAAAPAR